MADSVDNAASVSGASSSSSSRRAAFLASTSALTAAAASLPLSAHEKAMRRALGRTADLSSSSLAFPRTALAEAASAGCGSEGVCRASDGAGHKCGAEDVLRLSGKLTAGETHGLSGLI